MTDVHDFLADIHPRRVAELRALHNGDPEPRLAMWSTQEPVTLFGAGMSGSGWERVSRILRSIAPLVGRAGGRHPVPTPLVASRGPGLATGDR